MPLPWMIPAAIYAAQGIAKGVQALGNRGDVADAITGLGEIRQEQIGFAGQREQLATDVSAFGKTSTIGQAQMSYDELVGSTNLGYQETMSGLQGQLGDLSMQGTSAYGDIQSQTRARGTGGMAVQSSVTAQAQQQKSELLRKYKTGQTQIAESMGYAGKRKDLALGAGKRRLEFVAGTAVDPTTGTAYQEHLLNLEQAGFQEDVTLAGIEEQYQSGLTGLAGIPGANIEGDQTRLGSFAEGFFS